LGIKEGIEGHAFKLDIKLRPASVGLHDNFPVFVPRAHRSDPPRVAGDEAGDSSDFDPCLPEVVAQDSKHRLRCPRPLVAGSDGDQALTELPPVLYRRMALQLKKLGVQRCRSLATDEGDYYNVTAFLRVTTPDVPPCLP
jgi:hypothetical protein